MNALILFASMLATLIYTPSSKYFWHTPYWCPSHIGSAHTPGSSDYKSDTMRMVPEEMGSMYASLDGVDCRLAYSRADTTNVTRNSHTVTRRRLVIPEEYETYLGYIKGGLETSFAHYSWSSSAFDYNFRGYPTYCDSYWGKMKDFSWHKQPLDAKIGLSSIPNLCQMAADNPCGILPYEWSIFGRADQIQTGVRDVFYAINYGERTDGGKNDTVPEFLDDLRTNGCDHACGEDLSFDEVMWTTFTEDPRNIYSNSNRKITKQIGAYNQALSLIDRTYCGYYSYEPNSCCGWTSVSYAKKFKGTADGAVYYIFDEHGEFIRDQCIPKVGDPIGFENASPDGIETNIVFVKHDHASPRVRASDCRITGEAGCLGDPFVYVYMGDITSLLDLWFTNDVGYLQVDGGPVDDAHRGFDCSSVAFDVYNADDTTQHRKLIHLVSKELFADKSGSCDGIGHARASYSASLSVSTNHCYIPKFPVVTGADGFVSSKRAHVFSSFLSSSTRCPGMTNDVEFSDEEDCNWGYRLESYGYTTPSSLASDLDTDNGALISKIMSELKSITGSDRIFYPDSYAPMRESDAVDKMNACTNFDFDVEWGECHEHHVKMIRDENGDWVPEDTNTVFAIPCRVILKSSEESGGGGEGEEDRWTIREKGAVDTKRATVGEINWEFPIKREQGGVSGGSANFCQPIVGEEQYKDSFRDGATTIVDGDEPVYHVAKSGFEGAFGYNWALKTVRFSYLTNVMERGFAEAFEHCEALDTVIMPSLEEVGKEGFAGAFDGCSSLTNVHFKSLSNAGEGAFKYAFRGCTSITDAGFPALAKANAETLYGAYEDCTSLTNAAFPDLEDAQTNAFTRTFDGCTNLANLAFPALRTAGKRAFQYAIPDMTPCLTNVSFPALRTAGQEAFYHAFDGCTNLTGRGISFPALEQAGSYAMSYAFPASAGITNISFPTLKESPSGFLDGIMGTRTYYGPQVCLGRFDMRSATNVDVRGIEVGIITNRFTAMFNRLEKFGNTTAYNLWPQSIRNVLDIRLDESPAPFDGNGMFWSGTPEKLGWDSTVTVPQDSTNAWRNSAWTNLCDNIFGTEDKWMVTDYPDDITYDGKLTYKCRCSDPGKTMGDIGFEGGSYSLVSSEKVRDSTYEITYSGLMPRGVFRPYFLSGEDKIYGKTFTVPPSEGLSIDEFYYLNQTTTYGTNRYICAKGRHDRLSTVPWTLYFVKMTDESTPAYEKPISVSPTFTDDENFAIHQLVATGNTEFPPSQYNGIGIKAGNESDYVAKYGETSFSNIVDISISNYSITPHREFVRGVYVRQLFNLSLTMNMRYRSGMVPTNSIYRAYITLHQLGNGAISQKIDIPVSSLSFDGTKATFYLERQLFDTHGSIYLITQGKIYFSLYVRILNAKYDDGWEKYSGEIFQDSGYVDTTTW